MQGHLPSGWADPLLILFHGALLGDLYVNIRNMLDVKLSAWEKSAATSQLILKLKYELINLDQHLTFYFCFPAGEQWAQSHQSNQTWASLPPQHPESQSPLPSGVLHRRSHQLHRWQKHEPPTPQSEWRPDVHRCRGLRVKWGEMNREDLPLIPS